jgi:Fe-S cluster assembly iron-binding protein IscA
MADPIIFTDNAAKKVGSLIAEEGNDALKLRVYISGGGCSGFQFTKLSITDKTTTVSLFCGTNTEIWQ